MRADYDSEANALSIDLIRFDFFEHQDSVHDTYCQVGFATLAAPDRVVEVEVAARVAA